MGIGILAYSYEVLRNELRLKVPTSEPMAPLPGVGKKAMRAVRAVRTLQEGCQCSGWCEEMDRQILTFVSKRPVGDSIRKEGGLKGYSGGNRMRPW